jgi:hypothetical protein
MMAGLGADGVGALVSSPYLCRLTRRQLSFNNLGDEGARVLSTGMPLEDKDRLARVTAIAPRNKGKYSSPAVRHAQIPGNCARRTAADEYLRTRSSVVTTTRSGRASKMPTVTMRYYDLKAKWRKVRPHLANEELNKILVRDFNKYTQGHWNKPFQEGKYPRDYENADWSWEHKGREPAYWRYVKHAACHWLVNFTLKLAMLVEPARPWRIITSDLHSTVWDGEETLFDFNYQAMGISPDECFARARHKELPPGKLRKCNFAQHYSIEQRRLVAASKELR